MSSRTALITGANRGIGHEIARQLAAAGIAVVAGSRDSAAGQVAARALGPSVRAEQLDVSDPNSVAACERRLTEAGVEVDILVNNAGVYTTTPLLTIEEPALVEALQVNLIGAWRTARAFVPGMRARGWGRVVNVATGYAQFAERPPQAGAYGLAKASLNVLTRMIAAEASARVKVNSMSPGWVATRMAAAARHARCMRGPTRQSGWQPSRTTVRPTASSTTVNRSPGDDHSAVLIAGTRFNFQAAAVPRRVSRRTSHARAA